MMRVAVLSLTRDRLPYTKHCFRSLLKNAGCHFDHYVLDQNSQDATLCWLVISGYPCIPTTSEENIGISRGMNHLLDRATAKKRYDVVATFDNDCEVVMPGTLKACAEIAAEGEWVVSPTVRGLNYPPQPGPTVTVRGERVGPYPEMGGIFRVMPGDFARDFRFNESNPYWGHDERDVGRACAERGLGSGYLLDWYVNHYETTKGQEVRFPDYYARKYAEMA